MPPSTCASCRTTLRARLRKRIIFLQFQRRSFNQSKNQTTPKQIQSLYWETSPPTSEQLAAATSFFRTYHPRKLWTATEWRKTGTSESSTLIPEVVFLGRSNVGKSSLLNALLDSPKLNHVGAKPGKTTTMHAWGLSPVDPKTGGAVKGMGGDMDTKLAVLDMPGYGHASQVDWGREIVTYLKRRKQLRRAFLVVHAEHNAKESDKKMLDLLRSEGIPHQVIASKCDRIGSGESVVGQAHSVLYRIREFVEQRGRSDQKIMTMPEVLAVGALGDGRKNDKVKSSQMQGVQDVQWAVLRAVGLEEFAMRRMRGTSAPLSEDSDQYNAESQVESTPYDQHCSPEQLDVDKTKTRLSFRTKAESLSFEPESEIPAFPTTAPRAPEPTQVPKWSPSVGGMAELMALQTPTSKRRTATPASASAKSRHSVKTNSNRRQQPERRLSRPREQHSS